MLREQLVRWALTSQLNRSATSATILGGESSQVQQVFLNSKKHQFWALFQAENRYKFHTVYSQNVNFLRSRIWRSLFRFPNFLPGARKTQPLRERVHLLHFRFSHSFRE